MKLHIITIGKPRLSFAKEGWSEYWQRLEHYHQMRVTHIADKHNDAEHLLAATGKAYKVALVIDAKEFSSPRLATFLNQRALEGREVCFLIGGPEGLPQDVIDQADYCWSLGSLTFPHDVAMVLVLEALYRASTINSGQPYHK